MYHNHVFRNMDEALPKLFQQLQLEGQEVGSRGGSRVLELTHIGITLTHPMEREILLLGRKANLAAQIAETMWVLSGRNDVEFLSHYLPRAEQFSDDGEVWRGGYGPRLRKWGAGSPDETNHAYFTDQLAEVVKILKEDPTSRRAVMSIFDPASDYQDSKDIPCNNWLSFSSRLGKLDLHVGIRSNDAMWGFSGINAFEWSVLQEIVAGLLGIEVGSLHFSTTSFHLYEQHWEKARKISEEKRWTEIIYNVTPMRFHLPETSRNVEYLDELFGYWFQLEKDIREGRGRSSEIEKFPEPMLRSWLRVLQWWWSGDQSFLEPIEGSRLWLASQRSIQPKREVPSVVEDRCNHQGDSLPDHPSHSNIVSPFLEFCIDLHSEKDAAYGNSWKKRGEMMAILANIARKVDRIGGGETRDETSADTAIDLMIYLAKYRWWLCDETEAPYPAHHLLSDPMGGDYSDQAPLVGKLLRHVEFNQLFVGSSTVTLVSDIKRHFEALASDAESKDPNRYRIVDILLSESYVLARRLWTSEHLAESNKTRFWNPEKENVVGTITGRIVTDNPQGTIEGRIVKDNPQA